MLTKTLRQQLLKTCTMRETSFQKLGNVIDTIHGPLIHIDNGSDILAVAHLDTVDKTHPKLKGDTIHCPQLDDRLGAWTILHLLPELGVGPYDILLTTGEEIGQSTAAHFKPEKEYKWGFEFDRAGTDAVLYEYEDAATAALLTKYGWKVGCGSFSDISYLGHLGCKFFNLGVGYHNQHTRRCYANLNDTLTSAAQFAALYDDYRDTALPHTAPAPVKRWSNSKTTDECDSCWAVMESGWNFCPYCGYELRLDSQMEFEWDLDFEFGALADRVRLEDSRTW